MSPAPAPGLGLVTPVPGPGLMTATTASVLGLMSPSPTPSLGLMSPLPTTGLGSMSPAPPASPFELANRPIAGLGPALPLALSTPLPPLAESTFSPPLSLSPTLSSLSQSSMSVSVLGSSPPTMPKSGALTLHIPLLPPFPTERSSLMKAPTLSSSPSSHYSPLFSALLRGQTTESTASPVPDTFPSLSSFLSGAPPPSPSPSPSFSFRSLISFSPSPTSSFSSSSSLLFSSPSPATPFSSAFLRSLLGSSSSFNSSSPFSSSSSASSPKPPSWFLGDILRIREALPPTPPAPRSSPSPPALWAAPSSPTRRRVDGEWTAPPVRQRDEQPREARADQGAPAEEPPGEGERGEVLPTAERLDSTMQNGVYSSEEYVDDGEDFHNHSYILRCGERGALEADGAEARVTAHMAAALFFLCALLTSAQGSGLAAYDFGPLRTVEAFRVEDVAVDAEGDARLDVLYQSGAQPSSHDVNIFWQTCRPDPPGPEFSLDSGPLLPHSVLWSLFSKVRCGADHDDAFTGAERYFGDDFASEDKSSEELLPSYSDRHHYVIRCTPGEELLAVDGLAVRLSAHMESALGLLCFSSGLHGRDNASRK